MLGNHSLICYDPLKPWLLYLSSGESLCKFVAFMLLTLSIHFLPPTSYLFLLHSTSHVRLQVCSLHATQVWVWRQPAHTGEQRPLTTTSYLLPLTSYLVPRTSYLVPRTSHITGEQGPLHGHRRERDPPYDLLSLAQYQQARRPPTRRAIQAGDLT